MESRSVDVIGGTLAVELRGDGPLIVLVPSLGRGAADFDDLAQRLAVAGYRTACPEPRGIGATTAPVNGVSMTTLAADVAAVIEAFADAHDPRAIVVGHAFGNRVARMTAADHPALVRGVILLACGGAVEPSDEAARALRLVFDVSVSPAEHLRHVGAAFFADPTGAVVWADGWHPLVAFHQGLATRSQPIERWRDAGCAPVLVVQPADDVIAVPANADDIVERLGHRAEMVIVPDAGHALLPEQPDLVSTAVLDWLARHAT